MGTRWRALRWGALGLGAIALALGGFLVLTAHAVRPVETAGTISDYAEVATNAGYDHNVLKLSGDSRAFLVSKFAFHPALPAKLYLDGRVNLWVDQGSTSVIAMVLFDQHDQNPTLYTTDSYDHPEQAALNGRLLGGATGAVGLVLLLLGLVWPRLFGRKPPAAEWARRDMAFDRDQRSRRASYSSPRSPRSALDQDRYGPAPYDPDDDEWDPYDRRGSARPRAPYGRSHPARGGHRLPPRRSGPPDRWNQEARGRPRSR